jgi:hypothetical protein
MLLLQVILNNFLHKGDIKSALKGNVAIVSSQSLLPDVFDLIKEAILAKHHVITICEEGKNF